MQTYNNFYHYYYHIIISIALIFGSNNTDKNNISYAIDSTNDNGYNKTSNKSNCNVYRQQS